MQLSLEWLADARRRCPPEPRTDAGRRMRCCASGSRWRSVHTVPPTTGDLVVGTVLSIEELTGLKKPIRFCMVDVGPGNGPDGSDEPRGIICGATNFVVGDTVVVALPGSVLPGGFAIASRTTYGRISDGMICSTRELGIGTEHDGILVDRPDRGARHRCPGADRLRRRRHRAGHHPGPRLRAVDPRAGPGTGRRLRPAVHRPRRARRAGAGAGRLAGDDRRPGRLRPVRHRPGGGHQSDRAQPVLVAAQAVRRRYPVDLAGRRRHQLRDARPGSAAARLRRRTSSPGRSPSAGPVDGETLLTLDGAKRTLVADDLVVADESGAISLAGVMGGESTEITSSTTDCGDRGGVLGPAGHRQDRPPAQAAERGVPPVRACRRPGGRRRSPPKRPPSCWSATAAGRSSAGRTCAGNPLPQRGDRRCRWPSRSDSPGGRTSRR